MRISASQIELFELCQRKWWFERVLRLPSPSTSDQTFGTVLHAVAERYLSADEQGRVPYLPHWPDDHPLKGQSPGEPVNLYPEGWHIARDRFTAAESSIDLREAQLIKSLIAEAIESGALARATGGLVEHHFEFEIVEGVQMQGYIDYLVPFYEVQDHKTSGSRRWRKTPEKIAESRQMQIYAYVLYQMAAEHYKDPKRRHTFLLTHNFYCKDPKDLHVQRTSAEDISDTWVLNKMSEIRKMAQRMKALRTVKDHNEIPLPDPAKDACKAYGGCKLCNVCGNRETAEDYKKRIAFGSALLLQANPQKTGTETPNMGFADRIAKSQQAAAQPAQTPPAQTAPLNGSAPEPQATLTTQSWGTPPPWTNPSCTVCSGRGINPKTAKPCRMCLAKTGMGSRVTDDNVVFDPETGKAYWGFEGEEGEVELPGAMAQAKPEASKPVEEPEPEPEQEQGPEPEPEQEAPAPRNQQATAPPAGVSAATEGRVNLTMSGTPGDTSVAKGRKAKSFTICIGCAPLGVPKGGLIQLESIVAIYGGQLADQQGVSSYYELDAFKRRDRLCQIVPQIIEQIGKDYVLVPRQPSPDAAALLSAITPYASDVITAI